MRVFNRQSDQDFSICASVDLVNLQDRTRRWKETKQSKWVTSGNFFFESIFFFGSKCKKLTRK